MAVDAVQDHAVAQMSAAAEQVTLTLGDFRLRVLAEKPHLLESVVGMLVPACAIEGPATDPQWSLVLDEHGSAETAGNSVSFDGRLVLGLPYGGRQLAVAGMSGGVMRVMGRYRPGAAPVVMEVDALRRTTRLRVAPGDAVGVRWADWLARVFFASRLLASGWRMLHASAVAVDGAALVFLADRHGGKSTLAHRAVRELGARFLADDLVLIGPGGMVVGWPTRIAVPAELAAGGGRRQRTVVDGVARDRILYTPAQHRAALGIAYALPVPLGSAVLVEGAGAAAGSSRAHRAEIAAVHHAVTRAADIAEQLLYVSDPLGLMGGPRLAEQAAAGRELDGLLRQVPVAALRVALGQLPTAPVWQALNGVIPQLGNLR
ncbi:hypothetical protein ACGRHY_27655 [Streptomyces sp. HK10]|uniref:hypothetical protein n=1 Tax=Streptomyces sp. HK10 TaxID=3373255 RepID=UPI0037483343